MDSEKRIGVIGLGYVGLPLAVEFAKKYAVTGFDISEKRVNELRSGNDRTLEISKSALLSVLKKENNGSDGFYASNNADDIASCNIYIITVPTPIDKHRRPDLDPLYRASETVAKVLKINDIVIYESTVYPGVTEDECVPVLEKVSGLRFNEDFYAGYSPERINPGDKEHTIEKIKKITSGSTQKVAKIIDELYGTIITAGTHLAPSIKVAESAKVIENTQRDINIAFVNELAKIFNKLNIDTNDVLEAAATKWNFLSFKPGLVGGHCIGVDPYYLAQKAQEAGYHPEIILAGRRMNDSMGSYVADEVVKQMLGKGLQIRDSKAVILGFTFKENCPDVRNSRVIDIVKRLEEYHINVSIYDPWADPEEVAREYNITCLNGNITEKKFDAVIVAVAHKQFLNIDINQFSKPIAVIYDVKAILDTRFIDRRL